MPPRTGSPRSIGCACRCATRNGPSTSCRSCSCGHCCVMRTCSESGTSSWRRSAPIGMTPASTCSTCSTARSTGIPRSAARSPVTRHPYRPSTDPLSADSGRRDTSLPTWSWQSRVTWRMNESWSWWAPDSGRARVLPEPWLPATGAPCNRLTMERRRTAQAHLCLGLPALPRDHPDQWVLELLDAVLGDEPRPGCSCPYARKPAWPMTSIRSRPTTPTRACSRCTRASTPTTRQRP